MTAALALVQTSALNSSLGELEAIVDRGQSAFLVVGRALLEIRESHLYRERGFRTFGDYLSGRYPEISRRVAYNAIAAAGVDGAEGLTGSHLVELARLPDRREREDLAGLAAASMLTVRQLRELIRQRQAASAPRRPEHLVDVGPRELTGELCAIDTGDARSLPLEDGDAHLERVHGAPCDPSSCRHPFLVLTSPPYNAGLRYDADPTHDRLPWRDYWHGLIVPLFREVFRVLPPGGRFACNLANVVRMNTGEGRDPDATLLSQRGAKWCPPGAGGEPWAHMVDGLIWTTWRRLGLLARERITWIKTVLPDDDGPENTITMSTAWGTYCSPANPVLRAVAEPIFIASKASHGREAPARAVSDLDARTFKALTRNAWSIPSTVDRSRHPAPWPTFVGADGHRDGIPDRLIRLYTWPGDLVVDPMLGTGAAAEASVMLGRRFYGRDQSAVYTHDAQHRVARALRLESGMAPAGAGRMAPAGAAGEGAY